MALTALTATAGAPAADALARGDSLYAAADYPGALYHYGRANALDCRVAADNLALMYESGIACKADADEAARIWRAAYRAAPDLRSQRLVLRHLTRLRRSPDTYADFASPALWRRVRAMKPREADRMAREMFADTLAPEKAGDRPLYYALVCRGAESDCAASLAAIVDIATRTVPTLYGPGESLYYLYPDSLPGLDGHFADALARLHRLAGKGDVDALCLLGHMYKWGIHYDKDLDRALGFYTRAGKSGSVDAMLEAGFLEDEFFRFDRAYKLLDRAVAMGAVNPRAYYCLGNMCLQGNGCMQDREKAVTWYRKAVESAAADNQYAKNSARQLRELGR